MKEAEVLKACCDYLTLKGLFWWRNNSGATAFGEGSGRRFVRFGARGAPDILCLLPGSGGRLLCLEVKSPTGRLSPYQKAFLDQAGKAGALCLVVRHVSELITALEGL